MLRSSRNAGPARCESAHQALLGFPDPHHCCATFVTWPLTSLEISPFDDVTKSDAGAPMPAQAQ